MKAAHFIYNFYFLACSIVPTSSLPALANTVSCNIDNTCEKFTCCFEETELGRSIEASVQIDACKGELIVTLERMTRTISLVGYVWGNYSKIFKKALKKRKICDGEFKGRYR